VRYESSVTSVSWIPSAAITGVTKTPFELGVTHYDDPPPDSLVDLDAVVGPDGARFANELHAWIEVQDGRIVDHGQSGGGKISIILVRSRTNQIEDLVTFIDAILRGLEVITPGQIIAIP